MDRIDAISYSKKQNDNTSIIISISCNSENFPNIETTDNNKIRNVSYYHFDDEEVGASSISEIQAKDIADTVLKYKDSVDTIIVYCDAGVSRSAGVGAAIMKYLFNDDMEIFNNALYAPNIRCYRYVLNALNFEIEEKEIEEKIVINNGLVVF